MNSGKMLAALQLMDERLLLDAMDALERSGIPCGSEEVNLLRAEHLPEWVQPGSGGWLLFVEEDRYEEAMEFLGDLMGYEP
jgi:hypothetical protein